MQDDPKIIDSKHNGLFSKDGITVEVCICRLEDSKWTLEVVDENNTSIVWQGEFETDAEAYAEFLRSVETEGLDRILQDDRMLN